jgi:hypothetical protein
VTIRLAVLVAALGLVLPATASAEQRVSAARTCSGSVAEGGSAVTLRAVNIVVGRRVTCAGAKRLIRRYLNDALAFGDCYALGAHGVSHCQVGGWAFSTRYDYDSGDLRVRAKRNGRTFRFDRRDTSHG